MFLEETGMENYMVYTTLEPLKPFPGLMGGAETWVAQEGESGVLGSMAPPPLLLIFGVRLSRMYQNMSVPGASLYERAQTMVFQD